MCILYILRCPSIHHKLTHEGGKITKLGLPVCQVCLYVRFACMSGLPVCQWGLHLSHILDCDFYHFGFLDILDIFRASSLSPYIHTGLILLKKKWKVLKNVWNGEHIFPKMQTNVCQSDNMTMNSALSLPKSWNAGRSYPGPPLLQRPHFPWPYL